jgi:hypothetical protein
VERKPRQVYQPPPQSDVDRELVRIREEMSQLENPSDLPLPIDRVDKALKESGIDPEMSRAFARSIIEQESAQLALPSELGLARRNAIREHLEGPLEELLAAGATLDELARIVAQVAGSLENRAHLARAERNTTTTE